MKVGKDRVVAIDYAIRLLDGEEIESTAATGPVTYLHGRAQIVPGVERALEGVDPGAEREIEVGPGDGYGLRDPEGVFLVPRVAFPTGEPLAPGMTFSAVRPDGREVVFTIVQIEDELVLVDSNHPLAGQTLRVWVAVRAVREAAEDELLSGRVHREGGEASLPS